MLKRSAQEQAGGMVAVGRAGNKITLQPERR